MDQNSGRTPHPEQPAEGGTDQAEPGQDAGQNAEQEADAGGQDNAPLGGDENTEDQLTADTAVEEDTLRTLDPDAPPA
jgi:hypothetical protein